MPIDSENLDQMAARFERDQIDLDTLCAAQEMVTAECWWGNDYYGAAKLIKRYAGVDPQRSVYAVIPHGVFLSDHFLSPDESDTLLAAVLSYPAYRDAVYRRGTDKVVVPSASPFVYAFRMAPAATKRAGTIFFPAHSTRSLTVRTDWESLADQLLDWPEEMRPVTVMIYWQDYLHGHHLPFAQRGFPIVSAGHMYDPDFLLRQAYLLKKHRYSASNGMGSHVFFGIHAGCEFRMIEHAYEHKLSDTNVIVIRARPHRTPARDAEVAEIVEMLSRDIQDAAEQKRLADYYLGNEFAREPEALASLLDWLEELDRRGPLAFLGSRARELGLHGVGMGSMVPYRTKRRRRGDASKSQ